MKGTVTVNVTSRLGSRLAPSATVRSVAPSAVTFLRVKCIQFRKDSGDIAEAVAGRWSRHVYLATSLRWTRQRSRLIVVRYCRVLEVHPGRPKAQDRQVTGPACDRNPLLAFRIPAPDDHSDDRILYLGDDETGRALEVLTVLMEDGELVIHAMDLRTKYRSVYDAAKEATTE